jgi:heme/copper-type cytochrome/quinol oxidase subunit 2
LEQKQLDEIDESYFGEEFIDEETMKAEENTKKKAKAKKAKVKEAHDEVTILPAKEVPPVDAVEAAKVEESKKVESAKAESAKVESAKVEAVKVEAAKVESAKVAEVKDPVKPTDPWSNEESGFLAEVSTWKAITGIVVIALIFSVFTQGFQFGEKDVTGVVPGNELTLSAAAQKALGYVNENLLEAPFLATLDGSSDLGSLYKITLSVAGQPVDSYMTKDGQLFFPQGFDTSIDLREELPQEDFQAGEVESGEDMVDDKAEMMDSGKMDDKADEMDSDKMANKTGEMMDSDKMDDKADELDSDKMANKTGDVVVKPVDEVVEPAPTGAVKEVTLAAKKWLFTPDKFTVNRGDQVKLTIQSPNLAFTFEVPGLGVSKEISGTTIVEFTANQAGSFDFSCGSCESWRGMTGKLTIQ